MARVRPAGQLKSYFKDKQDKFDKLCLRCGACCGAYDGDPCINLKKGMSGKFRCKIYRNRLGPRETVSKDSFDCVPIKEILSDSWAGDWRCVYKRSNHKRGLVRYV